MERVYPRLKEWCQERGYQFQVVDMRWGVRDEATDDHRTTDLCLREIDLCKKLSTGPCFVVSIDLCLRGTDLCKKLPSAPRFVASIKLCLWETDLSPRSLVSW